MKTFRLIAAGLFFAALFSVSAAAQVGGKVGLINTLAFDDEKAGIVKYTQALKSLDLEFKKEFDELQTLYNRITALEKELTALDAQLKAAQANPAVPISPVLQNTAATKAEEYGKLGREYKFKQDEAKERYQRRRAIVIGPISQEIGKAMNEFAKSKGYAMILDGAKLEEAGILIGFDETYNVTTEFIKFFNARPTTAVVPVKTSTTTPTNTTVPVKQP